MSYDILNRFSNSQSVTSATTQSTDIIDLRVEDRDLGVTDSLYFKILVTTAFTDTGNDSTLTVVLRGSNNSDFTSASTLQTLGTLPALSAVEERLDARVAPGSVNSRYIRLQYTANNGSLTTGAVSAYLLNSLQAANIHRSGYAIAV